MWKGHSFLFLIICNETFLCPSGSSMPLENSCLLHKSILWLSDKGFLKTFTEPSYDISFCFCFVLFLWCCCLTYCIWNPQANTIFNLSGRTWCGPKQLLVLVQHTMECFLFCKLWDLAIKKWRETDFKPILYVNDLHFTTLQFYSIVHFIFT